MRVTNRNISQLDCICTRVDCESVASCVFVAVFLCRSAYWDPLASKTAETWSCHANVVEFAKCGLPMSLKVLRHDRPLLPPQAANRTGQQVNADVSATEPRLEFEFRSCVSDVFDRSLKCVPNSVMQNSAKVLVLLCRESERLHSTSQQGCQIQSAELSFSKLRIRLKCLALHAQLCLLT